MGKNETVPLRGIGESSTDDVQGKRKPIFTEQEKEVLGRVGKLYRIMEKVSRREAQ